MKKKTIVMIGNMSWGMHKFRGDLMKDFLSLGHRVVVIAPQDDWSQEIKSLGCEFIDLKIDRKGINPFKDFVYIIKLTKILINLRSDIVLAYTIKPVLYGSIASWLAGVPTRVAITTGLGYTFSVDNWMSWITKKLYWFFLKFSSQVWFLNSDDLSIFVYEKLVAKDKTFVLPGEGINLEFYQPWKTNSNSTTFTLISRMLWDKGVGLFVEAAKKIKTTHPHVNFIIVGPVDPGNPEGIPVETLKDWSDEGSISYLGPCNDVREILKETSCLVHPTYYKEGIPRVLMEANAMEIPCITTDIPGCRDVISQNENGFLVLPKNQTSLTEAILNFINLKKEERFEIGRNGRKKMELLFSSESILQIYKEKIRL